ncbi:MAG TPA: hypothetical protein PKE12_00850 [Kiritimatiellia bacterium]|nr:hypothetical protein [Kiritimatiellia bacterium]
MHRIAHKRSGWVPQSGGIWIRILFLSACLGLVVWGLLHILVQVRRTAACAENLQSIYRALELYELERGVLPTLAYFPDQPMEDADSLRTVLEPYGLNGQRCLCPASHRFIQSEGLTYIWNVGLNGQRMPRGEETTWMLVDISALTDDVPAPHLWRYNVLYSDGTVKRARSPLRELQGL